MAGRVSFFVCVASLALACGGRGPPGTSLGGLDGGPRGLVITTQALPRAQTGVPYAFQLQAQGGAGGGGLAWVLVEVPAPVSSWLALTRGGMLGARQTPDEVVPSPGVEIQVRVVDALGRSAEATLALVVTCDPGLPVACGVADPADGVCLTGTRQCLGGILTPCSAGAAYPSSDPSHCGPVCGSCDLATADRCSDGACRCGDLPQCSGGSQCCGEPGGGAGCVDLESDVGHCGSCGTSCAAMVGTREHVAIECAKGTCRFPCQTGFANCSGADPGQGDPTAGCVDDLGSSLAHCGTCTNACFTDAPHVASASCSSGKCAYACELGFADCNHNGSDGCEVSTDSDPDNCGACGHVCPPFFRECYLGVCGSS